METYRKIQTETEKKYVMISGGFMIPAVQNNSLNDSKDWAAKKVTIFNSIFV